MESNSLLPSQSMKMVWTGRVLSALPVLLFLFSGGMKLTKSAEVVKGMDHLGWPAHLAIPLGILELSCVVIYVIPQTAMLGAVLLTGYLGGAVATHLRVGEPVVMPVLLGVVIWLGLFLRDSRLRAILPLREI